MESENTIIQGNGSQLTGLNRWGDYSSMQIDPSDDCTFWYTTEYLTSNGNWNWHTRIGSFKLSGCGSSGGAPTSVTTSAASGVTDTGATMNGSANPNGLATNCYFRWSTTNGTCSGFASTNSPGTNIGSDTSSHNFSNAASGLSPATTYYFCAVANNTSGTTYGSVLSFRTTGAPSV